jgi:D-alanyl-D-alanine carboxypeptidase
MVDTMQWVAKRNFLVVAVVFSLLSVSAIILLSSNSYNSESKRSPLSCFESATATIRVTLEPNCALSLVSLGSGPLTESATVGSGVTEVHPLLMARFEAAKLSAALDGVHLYITSGFRSYERQQELFNAEIEKRGSETEAAKWVLPPQYSHHPRGLALDINYPGDPVGAKWLEVNGARFGLCRVYANEWWHFEGVIAPGQSCPGMARNALVDIPEAAPIS